MLIKSHRVVRSGIVTLLTARDIVRVFSVGSSKRFLLLRAGHMHVSAAKISDMVFETHVDAGLRL